MTKGIHFNMNRGDALKVWTNEIRLYRSGSRCLLPRKVKCSSSWIIKWTSFIIISWLLIITRSDTILFARFYWLDKCRGRGGYSTHPYSWLSLSFFFVFFLSPIPSIFNASAPLDPIFADEVVHTNIAAPKQIIVELTLYFKVLLFLFSWITLFHRLKNHIL